MLALSMMLITLVIFGLIMGKFCFAVSNFIIVERKILTKTFVYSFFNIKKTNREEMATQLLLLISYLGVYLQCNNSIQMFLLCALSTCLVILIITDLKIYIIPDVIQFTMAVLGVFYAYWGNQAIIKVIITPVLCYGIVYMVEKLYYIFSKKNALGMGDMKFFAVSGIFLPVEGIASFFFLSGILGVLMAMIWRFLGNGKIFPFGPALAVALYICLVWPEASYNIMFWH